MKKFIITMIILLALAGCAFFFGWANFEVPPGFYGVINSKTHGTDPKIVKAGEFRWIWYKLIPTNVQISVFLPELQQFPVDFNSSLPSGNIYAQFLGLTNTDFTWNLKGDISFSVNPDSLVNLSLNNNIKDQDELNKYMQDTANRIKLILLNSLLSGDMTSERLENILSGKQDRQLEQDILNRFGEIKDFSFVITTAKYPDFILYRQIRLIYEEFLDKQREFITSSFGIRAESHIESQLQFTELEKYGELLTKYPILLDYLALTRGLKDNE